MYQKTSNGINIIINYVHKVSQWDTHGCMLYRRPGICRCQLQSVQDGRCPLWTNVCFLLSNYMWVFCNVTYQKQDIPFFRFKLTLTIKYLTDNCIKDDQPWPKNNLRGTYLPITPFVCFTLCTMYCGSYKYRLWE